MLVRLRRLGKLGSWVEEGVGRREIGKRRTWVEEGRG